MRGPFGSPALDSGRIRRSEAEQWRAVLDGVFVPLSRDGADVVLKAGNPGATELGEVLRAHRGFALFDVGLAAGSCQRGGRCGGSGRARCASRWSPRRSPSAASASDDPARRSSRLTRRSGDPGLSRKPHGYATLFRMPGAAAEKPKRVGTLASLKAALSSRRIGVVTLQSFASGLPLG